MRSPTTALTWEIWSRNRTAILAIAVMTAFSLTQEGGDHRGPLVELLGMMTFVTLFAVFNDPEFYSRHFALPVSSLRLVTLPMLLGIAAVELLYVLWIGRFGGGAAAWLFTAVLFAAYMVLFQTATWTLAPFGSLRLIVIGLLSVAFIGMAFIPSSAWSAFLPWRSEAALTTLMTGVAVAVFLSAWRSVARARSNGGAALTFSLPAIDATVDAVFRRTRAFRSADAAHFWFEWRRGGVTLPAIVSGLLLVAAPYSWIVRADREGTANLLIATLLMPIVLSVPIGVVFSKPTFWSDEMSVPAFLAVRPLSSGEWVAIRMKIAALAAAIAWLLVLAFLAVWIPLWADRGAVDQLWPGWRSGARLLVAALFLTWRFLVIRLWSGLAGNRRLHFASGLAAVFVPIAVLLFEPDARWLFGNPQRLTMLTWIAAAAVAIKYGIAVFLWIRLGRSRVRQLVLLVALAGSAYFVALSVVVYRVGSLPILAALLVVPIARLFAAPLMLARNRHQ